MTPKMVFLLNALEFGPQLQGYANLGVEAPSINSGAIRRFENKLDRLYEEQRNLIKNLLIVLCVFKERCRASLPSNETFRTSISRFQMALIYIFLLSSR